MRVLFYVPKDSINEATEYYPKLMIKAFDDFDVIVSESNIVSSAIDIIVTIRPADQNKLKYIDQNKKYNYINWFQGIGPEEYELLHKYNLKAKLGKFVLNYFEKKVLKRTDICTFVSKEMRRFYETKYNLDLRQKSVIIPCYNKSLDQESFLFPDKYNNLSFVYAGALYDWQCIEETVLVFKMINEIDPSARLTLLTAQKQKAEELIKKFALVNIKISFVKLENLQNELVKYKYGFLLRKNDPINNVATPTKMNSYLAAGIIPINTNVI